MASSEQDRFDSVCAICDNGGELLRCKGRCLRFFHATRRGGVVSECMSLGHTRVQVEAITDFLCLNCQFKLHRCYACEELGSSDESARAEVFGCANATCGRFYHPECAAGLLFPRNETESAECQKRITEGQSFTCHVHKCVVCKQGENKEDKDLQFAVCRRCPKACHKKCLLRSSQAFQNCLAYPDFMCYNCRSKQLSKEIVDKLQWYVQNGDTIVDFCCGANNFSQFMKETLVAAGKKCSFKNYDIISPKNDFNFERRDWLTVRQNELPTGSQLIIGLNPPFGVKAALANKYIDKALSFMPKLVILIVPQETERLDQKNPPYDLIWEDDGSLKGKTALRIDDHPSLYLWSRPDWTTKHKAIASKQGHTFEESRVRKTMEALLPEHREAVTPEETNSKKRHRNE